MSIAKIVFFTGLTEDSAFKIDVKGAYGTHCVLTALLDPNVALFSALVVVCSACLLPAKTVRLRVDVAWEGTPMNGDLG